jgi:hypothetical protein
MFRKAVLVIGGILTGLAVAESINRWLLNERSHDNATMALWAGACVCAWWLVKIRNVP